MLLRNLSIIFLLLLRLRNHIFPLLPLLLHDNKEVHRDVNRRSDPGCLIGEAGSGEAVYRDDEEMCIRDRHSSVDIPSAINVLK